MSGLSSLPISPEKTILGAFALLLGPELYGGGAQSRCPASTKRTVTAFEHLHSAVVLHGEELLKRTVGILQGVKGHNGLLALAYSLTVLLLRVRLLNMPAVRQHNGT